MTTDFCIEAVEEAVHRHGKPGTFNTDQGSLFTSPEFVGLIQDGSNSLLFRFCQVGQFETFEEYFWHAPLPAAAGHPALAFVPHPVLP